MPSAVATTTLTASLSALPSAAPPFCLLAACIAQIAGTPCLATHKRSQADCPCCVIQQLCPNCEMTFFASFASDALHNIPLINISGIHEQFAHLFSPGKSSTAALQLVTLLFSTFENRESKRVHGWEHDIHLARQSNSGDAARRVYHIRHGRRKYIGQDA